MRCFHEHVVRKRPLDAAVFSRVLTSTHTLRSFSLTDAHMHPHMHLALSLTPSLLPPFPSHSPRALSLSLSHSLTHSLTPFHSICLAQHVAEGIVGVCGHVRVRVYGDSLRPTQEPLSSPEWLRCARVGLLRPRSSSVCPFRFVHTHSGGSCWARGCTIIRQRTRHSVPEAWYQERRTRKEEEEPNKRASSLVCAPLRSGRIHEQLSKES